MKIFNTSLNLIGKEESLRGDFNFQLLVKDQDENPEEYYSFEDLFEIYTRDYVVVTFLSILDLARKGNLLITQNKNLDNIVIAYRG